MLKAAGLKFGLKSLGLVAVLAFTTTGFAQCDPGNGPGGAGPDVIVGDITTPQSYGTSAGHYAYSIGTTSCNIGTAELNWIASTNQHPVIAQNMYRLHDGKFEHIGMSWLSSSFDLFFTAEFAEARRVLKPQIHTDEH